MMTASISWLKHCWCKRIGRCCKSMWHRHLWKRSMLNGRQPKCLHYKDLRNRPGGFNQVMSGYCVRVFKVVLDGKGNIPHCVIFGFHFYFSLASSIPNSFHLCSTNSFTPLVGDIIKSTSRGERELWYSFFSSPSLFL